MAWLIAAPVGLLAVAASIIRNGAGVLSIHTALFWAVAGAALALRYVDVSRFDGETASGQRATLADYRRYVLRFCGVALAMWAAAIVLA